MKKKKGFIVHPWETASGGYSASYDNHNKTAREFKTLKKAKAYLASKGVEKSTYDAPSGTREVSNIIATRKKARKSRNPFDFGFRF